MMDKEEILEAIEEDETEVPEIEEPETSVWKSIGQWFVSHSGAIFLAVLPALARWLFLRKDATNYIYTTDQTGKVYRVPAKEMKSVAITDSKRFLNAVDEN